MRSNATTKPGLCIISIKRSKTYSYVVTEINKISLKIVIIRIKNENTKCGNNATLKPIFLNLYKSFLFFISFFQIIMSSLLITNQQQRNIAALRRTRYTIVRQYFSIFRYLLCNTRIKALFEVNKPL